MYHHGGVTSADSTPPGAPAPDAAAARRFRPVRDMTISLAVLLVPLLVLTAFCRPGDREVPTVDPSGTYRAAKAEARFPVREPAGLPADWRSTNAALNRADGGAITLRVSYLTSSDGFVQLVQSDIPADRLIPAELGAGKVQGSVDVAGTAWQRYGARRPGETALVLLGPESTVLAVGDASLDDLRRLVASLR
jgi:hypothetical protein